MKKPSENLINSISRRQFLKISSAGTFLLFDGAVGGSGVDTVKEARYYKKLADKKVQCMLCPWQCITKPGQRGHCEVRENRDGKYYSLVYGRISAYHNDPVEKKPFFHFLPGTTAFSIASVGCNVDCKFCQNWEIARRRLKEVPYARFTPDFVVKYALDWGCTSVAFTYNEPTVFNEFIYDVSEKAKENNLRSIIISNGFINKKPVADLSRVIDAFKVDLKSFNESYYQNIVHGRLRPVLDTLVQLKESGVWTEIVYLVVPTLNDDPAEIRDMAKWIKKNIGPDVPLHFSRFYPKYKLKNLPPTPVSTVEKLRNTALDVGLNYVYIGNVPGHEGENTYCPSCGKLVIGRMGFRITEMKLKNGVCQYCGYKISGVWR